MRVSFRPPFPFIFSAPCSKTTPIDAYRCTHVSLPPPDAVAPSAASHLLAPSTTSTSADLLSRSVAQLLSSALDARLTAVWLYLPPAHANLAYFFTTYGRFAMHSLQSPPPVSTPSPTATPWSGASTIVLARYLDSIDAAESTAIHAVAKSDEAQAALALASASSSLGPPSSDPLGALPRAAHSTVGVAVAVLSADDEGGADPLVLVIQEKHGPARGIWKMPGGSVDAGEDWLDAAIREVREETGVSLTPSIHPISLGGFRIVHNNSGTSNVYAVFGASVSPEQRRTFDLLPQADEIARVAWLPVNEVAAQAPHMRDPESVYGALFHAAVQAASPASPLGPPVIHRAMRAARTSRAPNRPLGKNETYTIAKL